METYRVLALVGGISKKSINQKLYQVICELGNEDLHLQSFDISRLPFFSQDIENEPPDSVIEFHERIRDADAILFVTPEYNRSLPGVLKNAIDWGTRPYGQNLWKEMPSALIGITPGSVGTFGSQNHLRQILSAVGSFAMTQPKLYLCWSKLFNDQGELKDNKSRSLLENFLNSFVEWIEKTTNKKNSYYPSKGLEDSPEVHH